jgi:CMP-N,N'-diacetyllegionaminic acid synthase
VRIAAIIPARRGSVGIPGKNWKDFCGKPLVRWTAEQALATPEVDEVVVTSDSSEIYDALSGLKVTWVARPANLAQDNTPTEEALAHTVAMLNKKPDMVALLQATSPLRRVDDISACIALVRENFGMRDAGGSAVSVVYAREWKFPVKNRTPRQARAELAENGSIYAVKTDALLGAMDRTTADAYTHLMPSWSRYEIDDEDDWWIVEGMFEKYILKNGRVPLGI